MLAIGKTKPESKKSGWMKKKVVIMACCWVLEMTEISRPIPSVLSKKTQAPANRMSGLPCMGSLNQSLARSSTNII
ncbi:MAG: hypothetical protein BWY87_00722 [Deltaproteobacteria bacterium ADurb.Bin510]|nr:MAG: hypothetical protein BWY87_00722 [Deltaproteobacteria bacterium ADurb.Bin510]